MKKIKIIIFILLFNLIFSLFNFCLADNLDELDIYSPSVILIERSTGKIIYEKNAYEKMYPASITKIMTAILTLENCNLTDTATVSVNAIKSVPNGYSVAYLQVGEELTINQLLHVLLIPSANDAANVLAEHIAGSVDSFCSMMNTKAHEIGCLNTNFVNPSGIHNENHYSTAYDLSLIARYAMNNETFRNIVKTTSYTLPSTNKWAKNDRYFTNTNSLIKPDNRDAVDNYYYKYCIGIKTGYTDASKECIAACIKKDDLEFISVILGSDKTENGLSARYIDCKTLFNYAINNYSIYKINDANSVLKQVDVLNGTLSSRALDVVVEDEISVVKNNLTDISSISPNVEINFPLTAPISKNSIIGKITYNIDGAEYSSNLLAGSDVEESNYLNLFFKIILLALILFIAFEILHIKKKKKNKYKFFKY